MSLSLGGWHYPSVGAGTFTVLKHCTSTQMSQPCMKTLLDAYGPFTTVYLVIKKKLSEKFQLPEEESCQTM
jgi:hypothetical protein